MPGTYSAMKEKYQTKYQIVLYKFWKKEHHIDDF